jgi:hypothetical protein
MQEINRCEDNLIYLDDDEEIAAFNRLKAKEEEEDSENFDKILEHSEESVSTTKDARRQQA